MLLSEIEARLVSDAYGPDKRSHVRLYLDQKAVALAKAAQAEEVAIARGDSLPGAYVELRAEIDALAVISNCPQINNPANDFNPTSIQLIIIEPVRRSNDG